MLWPVNARTCAHLLARNTQKLNQNKAFFLDWQVLQQCWDSLKTCLSVARVMVSRLNHVANVWKCLRRLPWTAPRGSGTKQTRTNGSSSNDSKGKRRKSITGRHPNEDNTRDVGDKHLEMLSQATIWRYLWPEATFQRSSPWFCSPSGLHIYLRITNPTLQSYQVSPLYLIMLRYLSGIYNIRAVYAQFVYLYTKLPCVNIWQPVNIYSRVHLGIKNS